MKKDLGCTSAEFMRKGLESRLEIVLDPINQQSDLLSLNGGKSELLLPSPGTKDPFDSKVWS